LGALPFEVHVEELHRAGVRGMINMCEEFSGHASLYDKYEIEQLRLPTLDFTCPALEDIEKAVAFIRAKQQKGEKVYGMVVVHACVRCELMC